ncbi:hypothetical protein FZ103_04310 [Streptomonospora sp. PA3]|uniref:hypothetical protein n=1 Tax=Streptomonospora sp. PA3 TaxID=2607326 RepID=UPI0012DCDB20|nr:hypothetical protein [Streptomonospora sp. PA3]MUL40409.1 hypothetical protein [Streptomonospora sp. PA3]
MISAAVRARAATTLAAWAAAFGIVLVLLTLFGDALAALAMPARALLISGVLVVVMVNLVMPRVSAAVDRWCASTGEDR